MVPMFFWIRERVESVWDVTIIKGVWVFQVLSILVVRIWPPKKTEKTPLFQLPWTLSRRCDRLRDMAQPRPAKTYPLKVEQFAEKLPKPNSEIYASNHGLLRGELLNFGSVFVFLVNIRRTDFFPANFLKFISSIQQFLVAWNCLGWVGWFMDSPRHPWKSAVVFFWLFFGPEKNWCQNESCLAMGMMSKVFFFGKVVQMRKWKRCCSTTG